MARQIPFNIEQEDTIAADKPPILQRGVVERMKNAISMSIGLYEIRMNLFLWDLFRMARQKENYTLQGSRFPRAKP
ncbi:MAG: hypothetical protein JSW59_13790 [Phycisphaerales bacterium]|nr:MAG: hypothetical protein JSW59_13790 [Phycisphaerales bacterium]